MLFGNKQQKTEEKIFNEIAQKIKKSQILNWNHTEQGEMYALDTIDVYFDVVPSKLTVYDKTGSEIISMDCEYDAWDKNKQFRHTCFSNVLDIARKEFGKRESQQAKNATKLKAAQKKLQAISDARSQQQAQEAMLKSALDKIQGL